jgi:hypothetical protein
VKVPVAERSAANGVTTLAHRHVFRAIASDRLPSPSWSEAGPDVATTGSTRS